MLAAVSIFLVASGLNPFAPREDEFLGKTVASFDFVNDEGVSTKLIDPDSPLPIVVQPFFARCRITCSTIGLNLKESLRSLGEVGKDFRVVSLGFDPTETLEDFKTYRKRLNLAQAWEIGFSSENNVQNFLRSIDFRVLPTPDDFIHGSWVVVLSNDGQILDYVYGLEFSTTEFERALGIWSWERLLSHPAILLLIGVIFCSFAVVVIRIATRFRGRSDLQAHSRL